MLRVQRWDAARDGVLTAHRLRERLEAQGLWVTEQRFAPATSHAFAAVDYDVLHVVLTGLVKVRVGNETAMLGAGDTLFVPAGAAGVFEVVGSAPVRIYAGAFLPQGPNGSHPHGAKYFE
jgi:ethanolamine utilization protein EutQ (cupin superfamily)